MRQKLLFIAVTALFFAGVLPRATAQQEIIKNDAPRPRVSVYRAQITPLVTAQADDPAWKNVPLIPLATPSLNTVPPPAVPIPRTGFQLLWTPRWLYIRFLCHDNTIYMPIHGPNSPIYNGDVVEVFLDPVGDGREWTELEFNAAHDVFNQIILCTGEPKHDSSLRLLDDVIARNTWVFPNSYLTNLQSAAASWKVNGRTVGWIVDAALPAAGILRRRGLKKFQAMTLRGNFLRYKWVPKATGSKRDLLTLVWSPTLFGIPQYSPAAFGSIELSATGK